MDNPLITIIGNGFGGVYTARALMRQGYSVRLIGLDDHFTFTPLLHEVATGTLDESDVCFPIASFLPQNNLELIADKALAIDFKIKKLTLASGRILDYDIAVIATGARPRFELIPGAEHALPLKTMADAKQIKEAMCRLIASGKKKIEVNVIGGGFTGLELACEIDQLLEKKVRAESHIRIFETGSLPFVESDPTLSMYVERRLRRSGIDFYPNCRVTKIDSQGVEVMDRFIAADMTVLAAGVTPNTDLVSEAFLDDRRNIIVESTLQVRGVPDVFALGDIIAFADKSKPAMLAQLAVQQSSFVADNIIALIKNRTLKPYTMRVIGVLVSLGAWDAVGRIFGIPISGRIAWYIWRTVYLFKTPGWKNRFRIASRWTVYLFRKRSYIPSR